jgi:hypothetical protein
MPETKIESTKSTPEIRFDSDGMIRITGRSMATNNSDVYEQVERWIEGYLPEPSEITCIDIKLEYLNSRDMKFYISIIKKLMAVGLADKKLIVNWYYEDGDEDIREKGEYISLETGYQFNFIRL